VTFSQLFGGGARYSNGEDSLFLKQCLDKKIRIYRTNVTLGKEIQRKSTWFEGYTDKFFYDRGVLYHYLYGFMALAFGFRFIYKNRGQMVKDKTFAQCFKIFAKGVRNAEK
jgi:hypothetical protein